ncbi:unnamed protein product [Mycena citricolor]|uniref:Uncharacterized protein n=1 Tax=Mycena citricolor TaxID=2018698 RepID=A0AAD2H8W2_9AGAR|nr:unnamed protein product [Mycena citricolor]
MAWLLTSSSGLVDDDNLYEWDILIIGPRDTLYEGGFFKARLSFPPEFPLLPPKMRFITPMWHPNIYADGGVCISILHAPGEDQYGYEDAGERWMPVHTVESILISVISLLSSDTPNTDSPANLDAALEVRNNIEGNANSRVLSDFESDSEYDPGFIPGPVPIEELQSKKGKKKPQRRSLKRRDSMQSDTAEQPAKKRKRMGAPPTQRRGPVADSAHNVLLEFFEDIEPFSGGSSDEGDYFAQDEADQEDEDEEDDDDGHNDSDSVPRVNPFAAYRSNAAEGRPPMQPPDDPDATEPDTEDEIPISKQQRKASPTDDSVTESDTEPEIANARRAQPQSGSETEPDTEDEAPVSSHEEPKPGFPLQDGQRLLGPMMLDQKLDIKVPAAINTYLREYQRDGIRFFWERYKMGRGGLLGDDMGLVCATPSACKTIQVISFLSAIMHKKGVETDRERRREHVLKLQDGESWTKHRKLPPANATWPTCLIIAPNSVVMNWEKEFRTWGYFEVGVYLGPRKERKEVLDDFKKGRLDVVLTSQDVARLDMDHLDTLPWSCIFVDEAHKVKNSASQTAKAYQSFACICRFGLTGTAIQNSYDELWTQFDWTNPGEAGTRKQWKQLVSNPLKIGQSANATDAELVKAHDVARILHDKLLPRFFLRRTKDIIAHQLPNKTDSIVFCPLTSKQISVYKKILGMDEVQNLLMRDERCDCGSRKTRKKCCYPFNASTVLKTMSILIKLSNHLGLILPTSSDTPEQASPAARHRELARLAFPDGDEPVSGMAILKKQFCGKWVVLTELLAEWRKDKTNKVLIFTKSVKLLEMMSHHLKISTYNFLQLDGSTKRNERIPMIDRFNDDPDIFIFLISTMAGGTGLNLTGANKVVIFDPNWNPANDLQAMDRAFRFGQRRNVSVFRLLGAGSIEELIYARQVYKQQQMKIGYEASIQTRYFAGVQGDKSKQGELFGLENIFKLHEGTLATKTTIEKAHLTELDWALGSMEMPAGRRPAEISVVDIEKRTRDSEYGEFKGLGALLFDDAAPPAPKSESGAIQGMYIHQNPDLLVDSKVEQQRTKELVKKSRVSTRKARQPAAAKAPAVSNWPPKRFHKYKNPGTKPPVAAAASEAKKAGSSKPRAGHQFRLEDRITALIGTGMISGPSELAAFARTYTQEYSADERAYTMRLLDEYKQDSESDSDG